MQSVITEARIRLMKDSYSVMLTPNIRGKYFTSPVTRLLYYRASRSSFIYLVTLPADSIDISLQVTSRTQPVIHKMIELTEDWETSARE